MKTGGRAWHKMVQLWSLGGSKDERYFPYRRAGTGNRTAGIAPTTGDDYPGFRDLIMSDRGRFIGGPLEDEGRAWRAFASIIGHWHMRGRGTFTITDCRAVRRWAYADTGNRRMARAGTRLEPF